MGSNKFYRNIVLRILLLTASIFLLSFIPFRREFLYSISSLILVVGLQCGLLIRYILKQRNDLARMLTYIRESNPTLFFSEKQESPFTELGDFLNEIGKIVQDVRIEKEEQLQFMRFMAEQSPVGMISIDEYGQVGIFNREARVLTGLSQLKDMSQLDQIQSGLEAKMHAMQAGDELLFILNREGMTRKLTLRQGKIKLGKKEIRLYTLQDIGRELDRQETESWEKLIRILNHEIVNSITPITTLSSSLSGILEKAEQQTHETEKVRQGLSYIEERGRGLMNFVDQYRSLHKLPEPKITEVPARKLLDKVRSLKQEQAKDKGIHLACETPDEMILQCDAALMEQVLINLVNNAIESFEEQTDNKNRNVRLRAFMEGSHPILEVADNGKGIEAEIEKDIFVPFFTTREEGSGIGLSLSRQIIKKHGGNLSMQQRPTGGSLFQIRL